MRETGYEQAGAGMSTLIPDGKIYAAFDGAPHAQSLSELCTELLSDQKKTWRELKENYATLSAVRIRDIRCGGFNVRVQCNPARIRSIMADVGEKDIRARPCFLCVDNLPEGQKGIFWHKRYLVLCNPMPVLSGHLTICCRDHRPQAIVENANVFLRLMRDFGGSWTVLYNGPRCGASAPDHLHFQAIPSGLMPVEKELMIEKKLVSIARINGVLVSRAAGLGREIIVLDGREQNAVEVAFMRIATSLKKVLSRDDEPMMSIAGFYDGEMWRVMIFPRVKHRPEAFFRLDDARLAVSPGVMEMGGILVVPLEKDFERLDASIVRGIYGEVTMNQETTAMFLEEATQNVRNVR